MKALYIFLGICFILSVWGIIKSFKSKNRFNSLQAGDQVRVRIYATETCDCVREATVRGHSGKYLVADLTDKEKEACKTCSIQKGLTGSCWYQVTIFEKSSVI